MENSASRTFQSSANSPILIMTVDIGEGLKDNITIFQNSSIPETIHEFSLKHNLTKAQEETLLGQVAAHLSDENTEPQEMSRNEYFEYWNSEVDKRLEKIPEYRPKINKNSSKLVSHRQSIPVYERLYSLSTKSRPVDPEPIDKPKGVQCGDRLYRNWICKKQQSEHLRSKALEEKEEEINKTLTFKPQINEFPVNHRHDSMNYQKFKEENLERKRFELLAKEQETCTFAPQINPTSNSILQQKFRLRSKNKFEELYEEASIRKEKHEELAQQYIESQISYKPACSYMSVPLNEHIERLHSSRKFTEENLQNRRKELNQLVDPVTGQEFFKPKVGRPPRDSRESREVRELRESREVIKPAYSNQLDLASKSRNEELLIKKKRARYQEIFNSLNPCNVEKIYSDVITTQFLDPEVTKILVPLLQELEDTGEKLDFEEFFDSLENLCKYLTPEERYTLIKDRPRNEIKFEAKPRASSSTGKMYSRSVKFKEEVNNKLVAERIKKSDQELQECTFHPKIKKYKRVKPNTNFSWLDG